MTCTDWYIWQLVFGHTNTTETETAKRGFKAICHLNEAFPEAEDENLKLCREYLPHVFSLLQSRIGTNVPARYKLSLKVGRCLFLVRRIKESLHWMTETYQWLEQNLPEGDSSRRAMMYRFAYILVCDRQNKKAIGILEGSCCD